MRSPASVNNRMASVSAAAAHVLAWAAFLGIALWPCVYQGVAATPVTPSEAATAEVETARLCASFVEVNGLAALVPLFMPVLFTALALFLVLTRREWRVWSVLILWLLAVALLAFCVLGYLSFGVLYLPSALASVVTAAVCTQRRTS